MIFASNNKDKITQIKDILKGEIYSLKEKNINIEIDENADTCEENAIKKAVEIHNLTGEVVMADDSGLFIDYFGGWPGVHTHRFMGETATASERNECILSKMRNVSDELRGAKVVCVLALCDKEGKVYTARGEMKCTISHSQRGDNFFGFDSIVQLADGKTLACLTNEEKEKFNARKLACVKMQEIIEKEKIEI